MYFLPVYRCLWVLEKHWMSVVSIAPLFMPVCRGSEPCFHWLWLSAMMGSYYCAGDDETQTGSDVF